MGLIHVSRSILNYSGGKGGIRTHVTLAGKPDFESGAFDHSATFPCAGSVTSDDVLVNLRVSRKLNDRRWNESGRRPGREIQR